ncbi:MAG: thermostable hemolysin [Burkholderiaceae bacterium]|nr:thermostable hemolysin [Burkholderiaceae bacterium]
MAPRLLVHPAGSPRRHEVESFISAVYRERYGAELRHFAPVLVGLHDAQGDCVAAAGYRAAHSGALFLERYLPGPVETLLPAPASRWPRRERIVEVGHLAAVRAGEGRRLILLLGPHLAGQGFEWVVSTLTQELRNLFVRMGVAPLALGVADPAVLGDQAAQWGSYYDHRPLVLAGRLDAALQTLARRSATA